MQLSPSNKITKGSLGGMKFLYNPTEFNDSNVVIYNDLKTAGMSYPAMVYGGGERRTVTFDIYLNDKVEKGITKKFIANLNGFIPKASKKGYQFVAPKVIVFAFGWFVKDCYLVDFQTRYSAFSPELQPIEATVTVNLAIIQ